MFAVVKLRHPQCFGRHETPESTPRATVYQSLSPPTQYPSHNQTNQAIISHTQNAAGGSVDGGQEKGLGSWDHAVNSYYQGPMGRWGQCSKLPA